jgi:anti-sigma F factor
MQNLSDFKPKKDFLICVDSDGCAMDTMNIKHKNCFGPKLVDVYGLSEYREQVQKLWEDINLYSKTRGTNRFQALVLTLRAIREQNICPLSHEFDVLEKWTEETTALSNSSLEAETEKTGNPQLRFALKWSYAVNEAITNVIVHAYPERTGYITMKVAIQKNKIEINISDNGVGISDIERALTPFYTTKPEQERSGMGFTVMESFMDSLTVKSNKTGVCVCMVKEIEPDAVGL